MHLNFNQSYILYEGGLLPQYESMLVDTDTVLANLQFPRDTNSSTSERKIFFSRTQATWKGLLWIALPEFEKDHQDLP